MEYLFHFLIGRCYCLSTVMWLCCHSSVSCSQAQVEDQQRYLKTCLTKCEIYWILYIQVLLYLEQTVFWIYIHWKCGVFFILISGEIVRCTTWNSNYGIERETVGEGVGYPWQVPKKVFFVVYRQERALGVIFALSSLCNGILGSNWRKNIYLCM